MNEAREKQEEISNEQLVTRIKAGEDTAANMLKLWQQNEAFITKMARRFSGYADMDDLKQEGYIALCNAVDHYEKVAGVPFINYAAYWIRQKMQRYVESNSVVRLPAAMYQNVIRYKKVCREYVKQYGCEPSEAALRQLLDEDTEMLEKIKKASQTGQVRSLSEPIGEEGESIELGDVIASDQNIEEDVIRERDHELMSNALWETVARLPEKQALVIARRYRDGATFRELGDEIGCSYQYVRDLERSAVRKLRAPHTSRKYRTYWEQYRTPHPIRHVGVQSFQRTGYSEVERAVFGWDAE